MRESFGLLLKMLDPIQRIRVERGIADVVERSFRDDRSRSTFHEVKRRTEFCMNLFTELRGDLRWSIERILAALPVALRAKLDGVAWEPSRRNGWNPGASEETLAVDAGELAPGVGGEADSSSGDGDASPLVLP